MKKIRVRYAPSPTGLLHIGGARTAVFNYLFSKNRGGKFILRVEDTDVIRNIADGERSQIENLEWMGLQIDETVNHNDHQYGPYRQSERLKIYQHYVDLLISQNQAFFCYCSKERLDRIRGSQKEVGAKTFYDGHCRNLTDSEKKKLETETKPVVRFRHDATLKFSWKDLVRGVVEIPGDDLDDFIIMKANGIPTYNFAVVIDDHLMEISHAIRGEEHITNTSKQLALYKAFGWENPEFAHLTIITNKDGKKLSKRDATLNQFISDYRRMGYSKSGLVNFLAFLGWTPETNQEIFSLAELIKIFDYKRWSKSPTMFDIKKLNWMSNQHFRKLTENEYAQLAMPFVAELFKKTDFSSAKKIAIIGLYQEQVSYLAELPKLIKWWTTDFLLPNNLHIETKQEKAQKLFICFAEKMENCSEWKRNGIRGLIKDVQVSTGLRGKDLFMPLRIATTGQVHGPDLAKILVLLGKEVVKRRILSVILKNN